MGMEEVEAKGLVELVVVAAVVAAADDVRGGSTGGAIAVVLDPRAGIACARC